MNKTIAKRQQKKKDALLDILKKTPIVQIACEKLGIGRATYYRWRKEDPEFCLKADEALDHGVSLINDLAESKLIQAIQEKNMTAIIYWLKNHHTAYKTRIELEATLKPAREALTPEQSEVVAKALQLSGLITISNETNNETE